MTSTWSIHIDTITGHTIDFHEATAPTRPEALRTMYAAAAAAIDAITAAGLTHAPRYTLAIDGTIEAAIFTGTTPTGTPDHTGAKAGLHQLLNEQRRTN